MNTSLKGKCKELSEQAVNSDNTLTLVRGFYYCPLTGKHQHWWTKREDGTIFDPTVEQFPVGFGEYEEFDGTVECEECGKDVKEEDAKFEGRFGFCSLKCLMRFVGL